MKPLFLKLTELTFKKVASSISQPGNEEDALQELVRTPMLVNAQYIAQIFRRDMEKQGAVLVGKETRTEAATIIKLNTGLGFHVSETPEEIYAMIGGAAV